MATTVGRTCSSRRLHGAYGARMSVVNAGIGGNQVAGPTTYNPAAAFAGGPSGLERLDRDVLGVVRPDDGRVARGHQRSLGRRQRRSGNCRPEGGIRRLHEHGGVRVIGATITSSVGATTASGTPEVELVVKAINAFIRHQRRIRQDRGLRRRDARPATGGLRAAFQPNSTTGGAGR